MPITITIPTALRQFSDQCSKLELQARTVGQALAQLTTVHHELRHHLYRDGNELRNFINVYVNDEDVRHLQGLDSPLKEGDVITIVPSIAGGAITEPGAVATASKVARTAQPTIGSQALAAISHFRFTDFTIRDSKSFSAFLPTASLSCPPPLSSANSRVILLLGDGARNGKWLCRAT